MDLKFPINDNDSVVCKRLKWALQQKLAIYDNMENSDENIARMLHDAGLVIDRILDNK